MAESVPWKQPKLSRNVNLTVLLLSSFGHVNNHRHVQRRLAARALLTRSNPRVLPLELNIGWYRVCTDRAVRLPLRVTLDECLHVHFPHFIRRKFLSTGCTKTVKILKHSSTGSHLPLEFLNALRENPSNGPVLPCKL